MAESEVVIDGQVFWERLSKLHKAWHVRLPPPHRPDLPPTRPRRGSRYGGGRAAVFFAPAASGRQCLPAIAAGARAWLVALRPLLTHCRHLLAHHRRTHAGKMAFSRVRTLS